MDNEQLEQHIDSIVKSSYPRDYIEAYAGTYREWHDRPRDEVVAEGNRLWELCKGIPTTGSPATATR